jgi:hypothetical protein
MKNDDFSILKWGDKNVLWIESSRIGECLSYYKRHKLDGVSILPLRGYRLWNLDFLKEATFIKGVVLPRCGTIDISGLKHLKDLRFLSIEESKQFVDFSNFANLEELSIEWHPKTSFVGLNPALSLLNISKYAPDSNDISELPDLPNLSELHLVQCTVNSLRGITRFKKIKKLCIAYLPKLESLASLQDMELEILECEVCRAIKDYEVISSMRHLAKLKLTKCSAIKTIHFIDQLLNLRFFSFVGTNVIDGDMTPCLRLEYCGFSKKGHFSHSQKDIEAIKKCSLQA